MLRRSRVVVLGDLMVDVIVQPSRAPEPGTDVPGCIAIRAGGSAANTARWLARLGVDVTLVSAVGRDTAGRALTDAMHSAAVRTRVARIAGARTGRIGVLVQAEGERSFVADRGAADRLAANHLRVAWFAGIGLLHLPAYSLLVEPLAGAGRWAIRLARERGAVVSLDLASTGPLLARGRPAAVDLVRDVAPDILFGTAIELEALLGVAVDAGADLTTAGLVDFAPLIVVKQGSRGASVAARGSGGLIRLSVPTPRVTAADSTGAGDAFDAGFLAFLVATAPRSRGGLAATVAGLAAAQLRRAVLAGHRAARRQLTAPRRELGLL